MIDFLEDVGISKNIIFILYNKFYDNILYSINCNEEEIKKIIPYLRSIGIICIDDLLINYINLFLSNYKDIKNMFNKCNLEQMVKEINENVLMSVKLIVPNKKLKEQKLPEKKIEIKFGGNVDKNNFEFILGEIKNMFELNEKDILLIKEKLDLKITKLIKEKKIKNLKEKMNKIIKNFEFLINNDEFDYLEYLINNENFDESKLPKETGDKIKLYKSKKLNIESLFCLHNIGTNDDNDCYDKQVCQEYLLINLYEIEHNK